MERGWTVDLVWISVALLLVAGNGFFVAAEFALVKVRGTRLAQLVREKRGFAGSAQWLFQRLDRSLSACQLGITMASLGLGWVGEPAVAHLMEPIFGGIGIDTPSVVHGLSFVIGFILITAAHLVIGEQAPKIFALRRPEEMVLWCALPLRLFYVATYPLLRLLQGATTAILQKIGVGNAADHETPHDPDELRAILSRSRAHGELTGTEHRLVEASLEFDDTVCRQIMVPRNEVVYLDADAGPEQIWGTVRDTKHTRYPVCLRSLDEVLGVLHVKDLVGLTPGEPVDLRAVARPPKYVPETVGIGRLLGHFQATRQHMAIVADEFGVVVGVVTLENVLEQIVGPVRDEFDLEPEDIVPEGGGRFLVRGSLPLERMRREFDLDFVDTGAVDTLAGVIVLQLGRMATPGDMVDLGGASAEVLEVRGNRPTRIRLVRGAAKDEDERS